MEQIAQHSFGMIQKAFCHLEMLRILIFHTLDAVFAHKKSDRRLQCVVKYDAADGIGQNHVHHRVYSITPKEVSQR